MPTTRPGRRAALVPFAVMLLLSACAADVDPDDTAATDIPTTMGPSASPTASATPQASVREIEVVIIDGTVDTAEDSVEVAVGDTVRVTVTSDVDDEVHVHGVDQTAELSASRPTTLELSFAEPGVYEVETHESSLLLFQLLVR